MIRVKICGLTNREDVFFAAEAGADLLGFVFYPPSPRHVDTFTVRQLVREVRQAGLAVTCVGLFVDELPEVVSVVLDDCGLDLAQLHGNESPSVISAFHGRAYKAIRPRSAAEAEQAVSQYPVLCQAPDLLLDTYNPKKPGGTGEVGDWGTAAHVARKRRILLAGGLTPANVADAIRTVRPWGVDVSSGIEAEPGRKSHEATAEFITAVRGAERALAEEEN